MDSGLSLITKDDTVIWSLDFLAFNKYRDFFPYRGSTEGVWGA